MSNTPNTIFKAFLHDIEPSETTKSAAQQAHHALRRSLQQHPDFEDLVINIFLSGSYKRNTAIRPRVKNGEIERCDIDVIVLVHHTMDPAPLLDLLYDTLKSTYETIRKQQRSVRVETTGAVIDVVPIIAPQGEGGPLYIPDRKLEKWLLTNPPGHTKWTEETNAKAGKRFKPLVKMVKWWRREQPTISKKPKGFVVECIVARCMDYGETHYGVLFVRTLEGIVNRYCLDIAAQRVPWIGDPGVPGNSVTDGMKFSEFEGFYNKAKGHAELGRRALTEADSEKATELWRRIFGPRFPKVESTGKSLTAAAAAVGPLRFPDRPVRPARPDGFA